MNKYIFFFCSLILVSAGCAQFGNHPFLKPNFAKSSDAPKVRPAPQSKPKKPADYTLYFNLDSAPSGASVYYIKGSKTNYLGQTPLRFPLELTKRSMLDFLKGTRSPLWETYVAPDRPLNVAESDKSLIIQMPNLWLASKTHKTQRVSERWILPVDLKERSESAWPKLIPMYYATTAVLSVPSEPEIRFNVSINSRPPGAKLFQLEENGKVGNSIGELPLKFNLGMAGVRDQNNTVTNWIRWSDEKSKAMWSHTEEGELRLNAVLVAEGFQPELVKDRKVVKVASSSAGKEFSLVLEPSIPAVPQRELAYIIDSLPSGASVYELRDDGALGAKVGETPFQLPVGLAQELQFLPSTGGYVHRDWRIWSPTEILKWQAEPSGETAFRLSFALYKDGFAVETVSRPIFNLKPGTPYPQGTTLTFPLLTPEQAAARESRDIQRDLIQIQGAAVTRGNWANDPEWLRRTSAAGADLRQTEGYVWSGPPDSPAATNQAPKEPWWRKVLPR